MKFRIHQNRYSILIFISVVCTFYSVNAQDTKPNIVLDKTKQNDKIFKPNYKVYHPSYPNFVAVLRNKPLSKNELEIANGKENANKTQLNNKTIIAYIKINQLVFCQDINKIYGAGFRKVIIKNDYGELVEGYLISKWQNINILVPYLPN
ncbi:MAG: hypothetical protein IPI52_12750 [Bacteroidetes bacterium]|nr:hypothetical protein [Bacteroidota bacterium]